MRAFKPAQERDQRGTSHCQGEDNRSPQIADGHEGCLPDDLKPHLTLYADQILPLIRCDDMTKSPSLRTTFNSV